MTQSLQHIRKHLRQQRRALSRQYRLIASRQVANKLRRQKFFNHAQKIGIYLDAFGEVPTQHIIQLCYQQHKQIYLPQIRNLDQKLTWVKTPYHQWRNKRVAHHLLGMKEPRQNRGISINQLDLVIMPLLGFDQYGSRIGMGGGYYDRTLYKKRKVLRVGLAYEFQQLEIIQRQPWDQTMDKVITPAAIINFKTSL